MKRFVLGLSLAAACVALPCTAAQAAVSVTWGPATNITATGSTGNTVVATDILTNGLLAAADNTGHGSQPAATVNGVLFNTDAGYMNMLTAANNPVGTLPDAPGPVYMTAALDSGSSINAHNTAMNFGGAGGDANYITILQSAYYFTVGGTFTIHNLAPNHQYEIQYWVNDDRAAWIQTNTILDNQTTLLNYVGSTHIVGQYAVGTFVADATNLATFHVTTSLPATSTATTAQAYLNAYQIRDLGTVPEPASLGMGLLGLGLLAYRRRSAR